MAGLSLSLSLGISPYRASTAALAAPVLANRSSGWTAGDNPPSWATTYPSAEIYNSGTGEGDRIRAVWRLGGGAWTSEAWMPFTSDIALNGVSSWPLLSNADLSAGGVFQVYEERVRDMGLPGQVFSPASNIWSDAIAAAPSAASAVYLGGAPLDFGYGHAPLSTAALPCQAGDKMLVAVLVYYNTGAAITVTAVDQGSNVIPLTAIGNTAANGADRCYLYRADTTTATSITVTVDPDASTRDGVVHVAAIRNAPAGAPTGSHFEKRSVTNQNPHDVDGGLALPANGVVVSAIGFNGTAAHTYTGAGTKIGDISTANMRLSLAVQTVAGNILLNGQEGTPTGPSYGDLHIANTSWSPA